MASITRIGRQRIQAAITRMNTADTELPAVLTSHDAIGLLGRAWFHKLLRQNRLPGIQIVPQGVWRCDRDTFLNWLKELNHERQTPLDVAR